VRRLLIVGCLVFVVALPGALRARQATAVDSRLDAALRTVDATITADFAKDGVGGLSLGVVSGATLVWSKHYGYAEAETKRAPDNDTTYRVGSITKQFTALALLQLVEQGKMKLSDPLEKYVPEIRQVQGLPAGSPPITILQVATMHSGLSREPGCQQHSVGPVAVWQQKVSSCLPTTTYANEPGTTYLYSNIGYASLGLAVERAGGQPFIDQVKARILAPLGMSRSAMDATPEIRRNPRTVPAESNDRRREPRSRRSRARRPRLPRAERRAVQHRQRTAHFVSWELERARRRFSRRNPGRQLRQGVLFGRRCRPDTASGSRCRGAATWCSWATAVRRPATTRRRSSTGAAGSA
jgi:CubicO group peptidase (beta-lactamase class C family)